MKIKVTVELDVPEGATHYSGIDLLDEPIFYKMTMVGEGVARGEHWWVFSGGWKLCSHSKPSWIQEINLAEEIQR